MLKHLSQINSFKLLVDSFLQLPGNRLAKQSREKKSDWLKGGGSWGWWMPGMYVWTWARVKGTLSLDYKTNKTTNNVMLLCLFGLFLVSYRVFLYFDLICEECYFVAQCKKEKNIMTDSCQKKINFCWCSCKCPKVSGTWLNVQQPDSLLNWDYITHYLSILSWSGLPWVLSPISPMLGRSVGPAQSPIKWHWCTKCRKIMSSHKKSFLISSEDQHSSPA